MLNHIPLINPDDMDPYNSQRNSSVTGYLEFPNAIVVKFRGGTLYQYNRQEIGDENFEEMLACAEQEEGLAGFINTNREVRLKYSYTNYRKK